MLALVSINTGPILIHSMNLITAVVLMEAGNGDDKAFDSLRPLDRLIISSLPGEYESGYQL